MSLKVGGWKRPGTVFLGVIWGHPTFSSGILLADDGDDYNDDDTKCLFRHVQETSTSHPKGRLIFSLNKRPAIFV